KYGKNTMNVYVFHIYLIVIVLKLIPRWNIDLFSNIIIIVSPFLIMFILSLDFVKKIYNYIFNPIIYIFEYIMKFIKHIYYMISRIYKH
ncbi:MAG: hypothetical protein RR942_14900, partial [Romboutsia sp.]